MIMMMIMAMGPAMTIGTAFGGEGRIQLFKRCPKLAEHSLQHMILLDQHMAWLNLAGRVPVADMPGYPGEIRMLSLIHI